MGKRKITRSKKNHQRKSQNGERPSASRDLTKDTQSSSKDHHGGRTSTLHDRRNHSATHHSASSGKRRSNRGDTNRNRIAPLTGRNLQALLEQGGGISDFGDRFNSIALDMDRLDNEQNIWSQQRYEDEADRFSSYSGRSDALLEFGQLNPSSEHLSDLTSLDDVCFPDYIEGRAGDDTIDGHPWPDIDIMTEYIKEELEDLRESAADFGEQGVNFRYPLSRKISGSVDDDDLLPTAEDAPLLDQIHVNEVAALEETGAPHKPIHPTDHDGQKITTILTNNKSKNDALCRFTYFREDIEDTIHSPTLSGLVSQSDKPETHNEQHIRAGLKNLFEPHATHHHHGLSRGMTPSADPLGVEGVNTNSGQKLNGLTAVANRSSAAKLNTGGPHDSTPTPIDYSMGASVSSVTSASHSRGDPFWLDILDPSEEEMKVLSKTFGLHPLTTEDIFLGEAREKVELFRLYYFVCFTSFDIVYERRRQRAKEFEKKKNKLQEYSRDEKDSRFNIAPEWLKKMFGKEDQTVSKSNPKFSHSSSQKTRSKKIRSGELSPLYMYMIAFKNCVLTFHFSATPHPINVRRRARMLKDHLTVSPDWICYALIDDITDSFAPMIDSIESEVYMIEDEIMRMHSGDRDSDDTDDDSDSETDDDFREQRRGITSNDVFVRRQRSKSIVEPAPSLRNIFKLRKRGSGADFRSVGSRRSEKSKSTTITASNTDLSKIVAWKRKGDMLRRIGECRKRVMSVMRLLSTKADVVRGYSKRFNEAESVKGAEGVHSSSRAALRQEIFMYLGDIQDHIVTMVQSLNHYEKLLARSHSNYLAQINIDMTKVNNDTNDVLGKITVLGTIVLPVNVVTGLWGMNCIVPGQDHPGLTWFYGILFGIFVFSIGSFYYAKKVYGV